MSPPAAASKPHPHVSPWVGLAVGVTVPTTILGVGFAIWWRRRGPSFAPEDFRFWNRGWFERTAYTGGHDKAGHMVANYISQHLTTAMYEAAGYERRDAILWAGGVTFLSYNLVELFDGFTEYGWEYGDSVFNILGQSFAIASQVYGLDQYCQLRFSWLPSKVFIEKRNKKYRFLEDYNGQRFYLLANTAGITEHLAATVGPLKYLSPGLYYDTRGYRPAEKKTTRERNLGAAVVLDVSAVLHDASFDNRFAAGMASFFSFFQPSIYVGYGFDFNHRRWHAPG